MKQRAPLKRFSRANLDALSLRINLRPAEVDGGWRLQLLEDGEEVGGAVFPADPNPDPHAGMAWFNALAELEPSRACPTCASKLRRRGGRGPAIPAPGGVPAREVRQPNEAALTYAPKVDPDRLYTFQDEYAERINTAGQVCGWAFLAVASTALLGWKLLN